MIQKSQSFIQLKLDEKLSTQPMIYQLRKIIATESTIYLKYELGKNNISKVVILLTTQIARFFAPILNVTVTTAFFIYPVITNR